jgi:cell division protein FtsQ
MKPRARKAKRHHTAKQKNIFANVLAQVNPKRFCAFIVVFSVLGVLVWFFRPSGFPISNVKIFGNLHYVSEQKISDLVAPQLNNGFFGVKVSNLRQQLIELPWIEHVDVRRVWPGQLVLRIKEHIPAAFWQLDGLLSEKGTLFLPETLNNIEGISLPHLIGPQNQYEKVWLQYLALNKQILPLGLSIVRCELAPRGAWRIQLSNDIIVVLGTHDIDLRLTRFITAYQKVLKDKQDQIDYVDLRYTSGMSVGWRKV